MIYVLLAEGFEELEALAPVDLLRRAGKTVQTVAVHPSLTVTGAHHIAVQADLLIRDAVTQGLEALILPGGMPGTRNLEASAQVQALLRYAVETQLLIGAICAAPSILGHKGLLRGRRAVCFPGFEQELEGASLPQSSEVTVQDGNIITAKGAGAAVEFGLALVSALVSPQAAEELRRGLQCP